MSDDQRVGAVSDEDTAEVCTAVREEAINTQFRKT